MLSLSLVTVAGWSLSCQAAFVIPHASNEQEKAELTARWTAEAPWLARSPQAIPGMVTGTATLVPKLEADPTWEKLAKERPDPASILVDVVEMEKKPIRVVKHEISDAWRQRIGEAIGSLGADPEGGNAAALAQKTASELAWVAPRDARALMVGLINSLPGPERGNYFKMPSPEDQLTALKQNPAFNDDALKASFRAEAFGIDPAQVSRDFLVGLVEESLRREGGLVTLLRATWYAQRLNGAQLEALAANPAGALAQAPDASLDPFNADEGKAFLDKVVQDAAHGDNGLAKKIGPYVQKVAKLQINEGNYEERVEEVPTVKKTFRAQEVSAEMGATRGYLMQDCSMGAYGFAYSPQEFVYLVFDEKNEPVGFIAATSVLGDGKKTLFIHDFGGQGVTEEIVNYVVEGFYQALPQLGFEQLTIATSNGNIGAYGGTMGPRLQEINEQMKQNYRNQLQNYQNQINQNPALEPQWRQWMNNLEGWLKPSNPFKVRVKQEYLDAGLRPTIQAEIGYGNQYDLATNPNNQNAPVYESNPEVVGSTRIRIERNGAARLVEVPKSRPEAILRAIEMYNANPEGGVTAEMLKIEGLRAADLQGLFQALKNPASLPLEQYYAGLQEAFKKLDINMSKNFVRENNYLFWEGHLKAPDATSSPDAALNNRTAEFVILTMKRIPDPSTALAVLERDRNFFLGNEKFQAYLKSFTGHGPNEAPQIEKLMKIGYNFDFLKENGETLARLADGTSPTVREWAIHSMPAEQLKGLKPETVRKIAADLDNDQLTDDQIRNASRILLYTRNDDAEVIKELKLSVNEEEDEVVAVRVAIALIDTGQFGPGSVRRLMKNVRNREVEPETLARARAILRQLKDAKDARYCNAALEPEHPAENPDDA